jgi:hypothetical protein
MILLAKVKEGKAWSAANRQYPKDAD